MAQLATVNWLAEQFLTQTLEMALLQPAKLPTKL
jgi:hypothetical protein